MQKRQKSIIIIEFVFNIFILQFFSIPLNANKLGAPYFATFNGEYFVLFRTFEQFTPLIDRQAKAYYIKDLKKFSSEILNEIDGLEAESLQWDTKESEVMHFKKILKDGLKVWD